MDLLTTGTHLTRSSLIAELLMGGYLKWLRCVLVLLPCEVEACAEENCQLPLLGEIEARRETSDCSSAGLDGSTNMMVAKDTQPRGSKSYVP